MRCSVCYPSCLFIGALLGVLALSGAASCDDAAAATDDAGASFPDDWFYYGSKRPADLRAMEGKPAPTLTTAEWIGEPQNLADLKGKIVVVDFWATWCGPCRAAIPKNIKLVDCYFEEEFALIAVHDTNRGWEKAPAMIEQTKINYPVALDKVKTAGVQTKRKSGVSTIAWNVRFWPTYYVIDRAGIIRAAGLKPERVKDAVEALLAEPAPEAEPATQLRKKIAR